MLPLKNHQELESSKKLEIGKSYLYFPKEGNHYPEKALLIQITVNMIWNIINY